MCVVYGASLGVSPTELAARSSSLRHSSHTFFPQVLWRFVLNAERRHRVEIANVIHLWKWRLISGWPFCIQPQKWEIIIIEIMQNAVRVLPQLNCWSDFIFFSIFAPVPMHERNVIMHRITYLSPHQLYYLVFIHCRSTLISPAVRIQNCNERYRLNVEYKTTKISISALPMSIRTFYPCRGRSLELHGLRKRTFMLDSIRSDWMRKRILLTQIQYKKYEREIMQDYAASSADRNYTQSHLVCVCLRIGSASSCRTINSSHMRTLVRLGLLLLVRQKEKKPSYSERRIVGGKCVSTRRLRAHCFLCGV